MTAGERMRVLVAGCGYVGSALAARLVAEGHAVWGLRRRPEGLPAGVRPLAADLASGEGLAALPPDLGAVVCCVAADGPGEEAYRAAYVVGVRSLVEALAAGGQQPRRLLFTSSTSVYAQNAGEWVDEASPAEAEHYRGRLLREAEALLAAAPFPATVVRLGGIYGPGRTRSIEAVRSGHAVRPPGPRYTNRIHRDDAAGVLAHLLGCPEPAALYLGVDSDPADLAEVQDWLAARLGVPPPRHAEGEGVVPATGKRCRNARIRAAGYAFAYPSFREGYGALLDAG